MENNARRIARICFVVYWLSMKDHADIIRLWPSISSFADDIGVEYVTAQVMKHRKSIHSRHWDAVVDAAAKRGLVFVTHKALSKTRPKSRPARRPKHRSEARVA